MVHGLIHRCRSMILLPISYFRCKTLLLRDDVLFERFVGTLLVAQIFSPAPFIGVLWLSQLNTIFTIILSLVRFRVSIRRLVDTLSQPPIITWCTVFFRFLQTEITVVFFIRLFFQIPIALSLRSSVFRDASFTEH